MQRGLKSIKSDAAAEPVGAEEFSALLNSFVAGEISHLALAVSGGPDSMALAFCAQRWWKERKLPPKNLRAFIVDHGLRVESKQEAAAVGKNLAALGLKAEILPWNHDPVVTRLHATARKARYKLLIEACRKNGIGMLLLAHQRQDQAETIVMRLSKGSGIDGLAGMPAAAMIDNVHIARPFLALGKERLIATCNAAQVPYVNDPSNASEKFARGRLRRVMPLLADEGLSIERLIALGARAGDAQAALDHYAQNLLRVGTKRDDAGAVHVNLEQLRSAPRETARRAVAMILQTIHPEDYPPEHAPLIQLVDDLRRDTPMGARTLHGCLIAKSESRASFMREYGGITGAPELRAGQTLLWDARWHVTLMKGGPYRIKPLGQPPHELVDKLAPDLRRAIPQGRVRAAFPALWQGEELALIPVLNGAGACAARLTTPWPPRDPASAQ